MKRFTLAMLLALLALPASALAASASGMVLSVDAAHRTIQVVDSNHLVRAYRYRGPLPKVHIGTRISFQRSGQTIGQVKAGSTKARSLSFYGRVVRVSKNRFGLRLADGKTLTFSSKQIRRLAGGAAKRLHPITIEGLHPGLVVLVTETIDLRGNLTITIAFPRSSSSVVGVGNKQHASGIVSEVDTNALVVKTGDGSDLRLQMTAGALAHLGLQRCDTVAVSYHQDAGTLIADRVKATGTSTSGDCAPDPQPKDAIGTITAVSPTDVTIATQDQGSLTSVVASSDITDGFRIGDLVGVTYIENADGTLDASDVEYVEQDATGTVTAVSDASLAINDERTGQPETFTADPSQGLLAGVLVGDQVGVTYHQSSGQLVVDSVDDQTG